MSDLGRCYRRFARFDAVEPIAVLLLTYVQVDFIIANIGFKNFGIARLQRFAVFAFFNRVSRGGGVIAARDKYPAIVTLKTNAVGEITGWAFDDNGRLIEDSVNARLVSIPLEQPAKQLIIAVAAGPSKVVPIRAALRGQLISGLITDEAVARGVLNPS